ncbi:MAG: hypothetical protein KF729_14580 [Sandaracinaceae bacterium]|nr:hypothetical protein [Sandaracinaceae bacterium]
MKRKLVLSLLLLGLPACGDMLPNGATLERPRVLGARLEVEGDPGRAWPAPGETATLRWLVAAPEPAPAWTGAITACIARPNQTGLPSCAGEPFATAVTGAPSLEPVLSFALPAAEAFEGTTGELLVAGILCAGGALGPDGCSADALDRETVILSLSTDRGAQPANRHPRLDDEEAFYDERPWAPPPSELPRAGCASAADVDAFPRVPWRDEDDAPTLRITTSPDDREAYLELVFGEMPTLVESREELTMTHVVGAGRLARARTVILDDARRDAEIRWVHPPVEDVPADGLTVELLVVARDGRGGTDWTRRALCLVP